MINALKLLANQQRDGDSHVRMIVPGLLERSRRKMFDGLRLTVAVDNSAAARIGDLEKETMSEKVGKPKFTSDFPGAVFGKARMSSPSEHMKKVCSAPQAIFQGVEGTEWEAIYCQYKELQQAMKNKKSGENKKAKVLWALKEAKDRGGRGDFCDAGHEKESKTRAQAVCEQKTGTIKRMTVLRCCALEQESQVTRQLKGTSTTLHNKEMYRVYNHN